MTVKEKIDLITRNTEEILTRQELARLVEAGEPLKHYIGFEISGKVHLGTGIMTMLKIKDFMDAGAETRILLADWHTWMNDKFGGELAVIHEVGVGYFTEALKASFLCVGGDPERLRFIFGTELYHNNDQYWQTVVEIAKHVSRARVARSIGILGRKEGEAGDFAKLMYPVMQVADIFALGANLVHAGTDQRKAHVIARHAASQLAIKPLRSREGKVLKPVAIHHHLLLGLGKSPAQLAPRGAGESIAKGKKRELFESMKMSKSKPGSAIFVHDGEDEIKKKVMDAFCPPEEVDFNPIMDWAKWLVFGANSKWQIANGNSGGGLKIPRAAKYGGPISFGSYGELEKTYTTGKLHPEDLKLGMAEWLIAFLEPARKYFQEPKSREALRRLEEIL